MSPLVGRYSPSRSLPKVVLPEAGSPTRARGSQGRMGRRNAATPPACSVGLARPSPSRPAEKCLATSRVSMIGAAASGPASAASAGLAAVTALPSAGVRLQREPAGVGAAVHLQDRTGDVAGVAGGQEQHGAGDVARR